MKPLPTPSGPLVLGVTDLETTDLLVRLFYPTRKSPATLTSSEVRPTWLPDLAYARGYGDFLGYSAVVSVPLFGIMFAGLKIPQAVLDAPFFPASSDKLPIVIFSHGLGGMRTTYANICADIASHGFLVASIEHRDRSASMTLKNGAQDQIPYQFLPKDVDEFEYRNSQVRHRASEVVKTYELLKLLNEGAPIKNIFKSQFDHSKMKDRLDFTRVVVAGHSFGGGTAIQSVYFNPTLFQCAICLDGWMFPVDREVFEDKPYEHEAKPVFFLNTELFQWKENLDRMNALVTKFNRKQEELSKAPGSILMTIKGSAHQNQSDFALVVPTFILRKSGMLGPIDPHLCMALNNRACLKFIQRHLPFESESVSQDEILSEDEGKRPKEMIFGTPEKQAEDKINK